MTIDELRKLIAHHKGVVEFADYGDGVSSRWVALAQAELGETLPGTYKWWLMHYSGGEVGGEEIFSVYEQPFDEVVGGDIVYMHRVNQRAQLLAPRQVAVCESNVDGLFFFDFEKQRDDGECPVVSAVTGKVYADDFVEFLRLRIEAGCAT
jgi:hypothetical protein